ncbi:methylosome protein WDR77-like [Ornithodoros turicata]|uniref:methylosome protein WDR77-like n=1 Tax=Ornithodoros turicata TaxID=34597 RepID=UPI003139694F
MATVLPTTLHDDIDVLQHCDDGSVVLASNNLTGRQWEGSVWSFKSAADVPDRVVSAVATDAGVADVAVCSSTRFLLGLDCGAVELLYLIGESPSVFETRFYACEHDDGITSISLSPNGAWLATSSRDMSIKVWDMTTMICTYTYAPAHSGTVSKVEFSTDPNVFLSCSEDGRVCSWDMRLPRPAVALGKCSCVPTTVAWQPASATTFAIGYESGEISLRDIRGCRDTAVFSRHERRIHRLCFSPTSPTWLASCADETKVCVADVSKQDGNPIYSSEGHKHFVRGLSWEPSSNHLWSCGWDRQVREHVPSSPMDTNGQGDAQ